MEAPDKKTVDVTDVELTEVNKEKGAETKGGQESPIVSVNITFCTHVGWDGILVVLFSLCIASMFVYVTFVYTREFQVWNRPGVWVFMVFAAFYVILVIKFLWTWKKLAKFFTNQQQKNSQEAALKDIKEISGKARNIYKKCQIYGQWFLWKLYFFELFESTQQCINLITVYLCSLPVEWTSFICLGLALEGFHTGWTMIVKNTPIRRNRQIRIDTMFDFLAVTIPLCIMWFRYQVPVSISEMLAITMFPTFSMLAKLDDIFEEGVHHRSAQQVLREQARVSLIQKRHRKSLFTQVEHLMIAQKQGESMPRIVKLAIATCKGLFGVFFLVVAIAHLSTQLDGCDQVTWSKGCVNKIPFCKSLTHPTCNCVFLKIEKNYKLVTLPNSLVDEMDGLRKVLIRNCNLTKLPPRMEQLVEMVDFEISFNRLQEFMVDIKKWNKLNTLYLDNNNITKYNKEAVWTHNELVNLHLSNNTIRLPTSGIDLPSLMFLHFSENHISINKQFNKDSFPNLIYLFLNGNNLMQFPDKSLKDNLRYLGIARGNLKSLPRYLSGFRSLLYLDVRNNNITKLENNLIKFVKKNNIEAYFSGNPLCSKDNTLDCEPLCSKTCWSKHVRNDGVCDETCNTEDCELDGGDCQL